MPEVTKVLSRNAIRHQPLAQLFLLPHGRGVRPLPLREDTSNFRSCSQHHFLGNNPLNRLSFLRDHAAFVNAAAAHQEAKWVLFRTGGQPLVKTSHAQRTTHLALLPTSAIAHLIGPAPLFGQGQNEGEAFEIPAGEKVAAMESARLRGPTIIFLGVLEKTSEDAIPSKDNEWRIDGAPYFALDVQHVEQSLLDSLTKDLTTDDLEVEFVDPFATMGDFEPSEAAIFAEGRSMWDWNSRRRFCAACGERVHSLWAGWKLGCSSLVPWANNGDKPPCPSGYVDCKQLVSICVHS